jgi:hypothetical protein
MITIMIMRVTDSSEVEYNYNKSKNSCNIIRRNSCHNYSYNSNHTSHDSDDSFDNKINSEKTTLQQQQHNRQ